MRCVVEVTFPADVLHRCYPNGKLGGLTIDGTCPGALGSLVELVVRIERPAREFKIRGQLAWARHRGSKELKESYGVDFLGDDEGAARLLALARQELGPEAMRGEVRVLADLQVKLTHQGRSRREFLADLSAGGAFIRSAEPLDPGEEVQLHARGPGQWLGVHLKGRVAWARKTGVTGFGIEFVDDDGKQRERLAKLLSRLQVS